MLRTGASNFLSPVPDNVRAGTHGPPSRSAGDIVVMSSSMDTDGLATTRKKLSSEIDTASNPASSASESDGGQLEQEDRVGVDDISGQDWFAVVEYFFQSRNEDELRVHLSWSVACLAHPPSRRRAH